MSFLLAAIAVFAWAATIVAALLRRGGSSVRSDVDGVPYVDIDSRRSRIAFWLSVVSPTVGLVATLLVLISQ